MTQALYVSLGAIVGLLLAMALSQLWMGLRARRSIGRPIPEAGPSIGSGAALLYFTSPTCGPCRAMTPRIEALAARGARIEIIDVHRDPEIARAWGVMATPTTIAVEGGQIRDVLVGVVPVERLAAMVLSEPHRAATQP